MKVNDTSVLSKIPNQLKIKEGQTTKYNNGKEIERWDIFELELETDAEFSNPFSEVHLETVFRNGAGSRKADGFYDGKSTWRVRFMPEEPGEYTFATISDIPEFNDIKGSFICTEASRDNHGPVRVDKKYHFSYADSTPFFVMGTTAYAWTYMPGEMRAKTLESFRRYGFNKIRMLFFPKRLNGFDDIDVTYDPPCYPFEGEKGAFDFTRFNPEYFRNFEERVRDLKQLGIEADVILFHFYDFGQWGIDSGMKTEDQLFYLKYLMARLAAFSNVWWSLANEYDMMVDYKTKSFRSDPRTKYWDCLGNYVRENDPCNHLRSIHNMVEIYPDREWLTHVSYQRPNTYSLLLDLKNRYGKPVIDDEYEYEGNLNSGWGNNTPEQEVFSHWLSVMAGGYATHGETYIVDGNKRDIFWSYGGTLVGQSPRRLKYLKEIIGQCPFQEMEPDLTRGDGISLFCLKKDPEVYLYFIRNAYGLKWFPQLYPRNALEYAVTVYDAWDCVTKDEFRLEGKDNEFLSPGINHEIKDWYVVKFVRVVR